MSKIKLNKGVSIRLKKDDDLLKQVRADISWHNGDENVDVDVSCLGVALDGTTETLYSEDYFVFYNHLETENASIKHLGDERNEGGETILFDLTKIPVGVVSIAVFVTIDKATQRKQTFGLVKDASVKISNDSNDEVLAEYNIKNEFKKHTAIQVGAFYRVDDEWEFKALGEGMVADLGDILAHYGVTL